MQRSFVRSLVLRIGIVAYFTIITLIVFHDVVFQDNFFLNDTLGYKTWVNWLAWGLGNHGQIPNWSPLWSSGIPFPNIAFLTPFLVIAFFKTFMDIYSAISFSFFVVFALAGVTMFIYVKHITKSWLAGIAAGSFYIIFPPHTVMYGLGHFEAAFAYMLMPLLIWQTEKFFDRPTTLNAAFISGIALLTFTNQPSLTVIYLTFYAFYLAFCIIRKRNSITRIIRIIIESIRQKASVLQTLSRASMPIKRSLGILLTAWFLFNLFAQYFVITESVGISALLPEDDKQTKAQYSIDSKANSFFVAPTDPMIGWAEPSSEWYLTPISLLILIVSPLLLLYNREARRYWTFIVFAEIVSIIYLDLAVFDSISYNTLNTIMPDLSELRVLLRFLYVFVFAVSVLSGILMSNLVRFGPNASDQRRDSIIFKSIIMVLVVGSFAFYIYPSYLNYYDFRIIPKDDLENICSSFNNLHKDNDRPVRVLTLAYYGNWIVAEQCADPDNKIEVTSDWLYWSNFRGNELYNQNLLDRIWIFDPTSIEFVRSQGVTHIALLDHSNYPFVAPPEGVAALKSFLDGRTEELIFEEEVAGSFYKLYLYSITQHMDILEFENKSANGRISYLPNGLRIHLDNTAPQSFLLRYSYNEFWNIPDQSAQITEENGFIRIETNGSSSIIDVINEYHTGYRNVIGWTNLLFAVIVVGVVIYSLYGKTYKLSFLGEKRKLQ